MTTAKHFAMLAAKARVDPGRRQRIATFERMIDDALALAVVRAMRGKTPREVVQILETSRLHILRVKPERDFYIETLRSYLAAIADKA